ncbi:MurR/RpiR family transcriptional regulator [Candidatus Stoquefichus massiliensis]|uniref:MurR/RpiR family transcriptional regulator n=1 Tax=Candidatus Stoquefichus massiliensis TaxID=1470350 RepID=UPI0004850AE1|nr:MurR/RpiR family transcriptional regulator [Candidatus Stoquefichus massiliensis]
MLIQEKLKEKDAFSDIEKNIAEYILKIDMKIKKESVRHIAEHTYTSPSSVMRFCQKLGFEGYVDFKEAYIQEIEYLSSHFQDVDANYPFLPNDKNVVIANKIGILYEETIKDTLSLIHHDSLQQAANMLDKAKNIYVCSSGASKDIAKVFKDNMLKIGKTVISYHNTSDIYYEACFCDQTNCFIIISYSGETARAIKVAQKLKERHIPMIAITSYGHNTLTNLSKCCLHISTRQKLISNLGNFSINLSILYILDILYANCFHFHYHQYLEDKIKYSHEMEIDRKSDNPILKEE